MDWAAKVVPQKKAAASSARAYLNFRFFTIGFIGFPLKKVAPDYSIFMIICQIIVFILFILYNKDSYGKIYDAEMENLNHKSVESHHLPQRSRYYQGAIDIDYMDQGKSYKELPESNVMFICTFDPFGQGLGQYTFVEQCLENTVLVLNDGTKKIFYN